MPNVYIEARPKGRPEGSAVDDFVVEDHAGQVLADAEGSNRVGTEEQPFAARCPRATSQRQENPRSLARRVGTGFLSGRSLDAT